MRKVALLGCGHRWLQRFRTRRRPSRRPDEDVANPNKNTKFVPDAVNPYAATASLPRGEACAGAKVAKRRRARSNRSSRRLPFSARISRALSNGWNRRLMLLHQASVLLLNAYFPLFRLALAPAALALMWPKTHSQINACASPGFGVRSPMRRSCYRAQAYRHRDAGRNRGIRTMKKFVFAVVIAAVAASPAMAAKKKSAKKPAAAPVASTPQQQRE